MAYRITKPHNRRGKDHGPSHPSILIALIVALLAAACSAGDTSTSETDGGGLANEGGGLATEENDRDSGDSDSPASTAEEGSTDDVIRIGLLSTLEGPFTSLGEDAYRGAKLAMLEYGGQLEGTAPRDAVTGVTVAGHPVEILYESSDGNPDIAVEATRRLVQQEEADVVVGPASGDEGLAIKDYAKDNPDRTFVNGSSAATETTLTEPAENFFRFNGDGVQWIAGLGTYAAEELGYRRVATVAEDYSYPYAQVGGFQLQLCRAGGDVVEKAWVPIGTSDYASIIQRIPSDVDAVFVALAGTDIVNFVQQYDDFTGGEVPLIAASSSIDQSTLQELGERMVGVPAAAPAVGDLDTAAWQEFAAAYKENFPDGLPAPSTFALTYYTNMKAALMGLEEVGADLSDSHSAYRDALAGLEVESPTGMVTLDDNRNGIVPNFVFEVVERDGTFANETKVSLEDINQTLGTDEQEYRELAPYTRDFTCPSA